MNGIISSWTVPDSHARVQPDSTRRRQGVIGVDKTALGAFEMVRSQGVRYATELERVDVVEWG